MPPDTVPRESYELAIAQAETYRNLLYTVTPALVAGIIFLFLRLQAFGEKCAIALVQVTDAVQSLTEELRRGRKE
jgi:hypothetical protein